MYTKYALCSKLEMYVSSSKNKIKIAVEITLEFIFCFEPKLIFLKVKNENNP